MEEIELWRTVKEMAENIHEATYRFACVVDILIYRPLKFSGRPPTRWWRESHGLLIPPRGLGKALTSMTLLGNHRALRWHVPQLLTEHPAGMPAGGKASHSAFSGMCRSKWDLATGSF